MSIIHALQRWEKSILNHTSLFCKIQQTSLLLPLYAPVTPHHGKVL